MQKVSVKTYTDLVPRRSEVLRYLGIPKDGELPLLDECEGQLQGVTGQVCYTECPVGRGEEGLLLGPFPASSKDLAAALRGCERAVVFAATAGIVFDRLIARNARLSPSRAVVFQALGTEYAEALCDAFCRDLASAYAQEGTVLRPRFSPGYGDFPLAFQKQVFQLLSPECIGIALGENLLMTPSKSVTAVIGLRKEPT